MKARLLWTPPLLLLIGGVLGLLIFGFGRDPSMVPSPLIGKRAPAFHLGSVDGGPVTVPGRDQRPTVLNFFASWCVPCHQEQPVLERAYRRWRRRVRFLGVIFEDSPKAARSFMRSGGGTWPGLVDPDGNTAVNYGVTGIPETFFISQKGEITDKALFLTWPVLSEDITRLLQKPARRKKMS